MKKKKTVLMIPIDDTDRDLRDVEDLLHEAKATEERVSRRSGGAGGLALLRALRSVTDQLVIAEYRYRCEWFASDKDRRRRAGKKA